MTDVVTSARIMALLELRYPPPEWAFFSELAVGTGSYMGRTMDAFVLNVWPSKGFRSIAFEVKVSRSDFMREVRDPTKRAAAEKYAGECYFVTPAGLVKPDEVPESWGLLEVTAGIERSIRVKKIATQRTPEPWPMSFIASLARRSAPTEMQEASKAWKYAGREMDLTELRSVCEDVFRMMISAAENKANMNAVREFMDGPQYRGLTELSAAVIDKCGWNVRTGQDFRKWLEGVTAGTFDRALATVEMPVRLVERLKYDLSEMEKVVEDQRRALAVRPEKSL